MMKKFDNKVIDRIVHDLNNRVRPNPVIALWATKKLVVENALYVLDDTDTKTHYFYLNNNRSIPVKIGMMISVLMDEFVELQYEKPYSPVSIFSYDDHVIFVGKEPYFHFTTVYTDDYSLEDNGYTTGIYCFSWSKDLEKVIKEHEQVKNMNKLIEYIKSLRGTEK